MATVCSIVNADVDLHYFRCHLQKSVELVFPSIERHLQP